MLLINKFRNKYRINKAQEQELDEIIRNEVSSLVNDKLMEKKLTQLDKKLDQVILQWRKESRNKSQPHIEPEKPRA